MTIYKLIDYTVEGPDLGTPISIDDLRSLADRCGSHFFDRTTMRFFRSRIGDTVKTRPDGWYFITSEQYAWCRAPHRRRYTLRRAYYRHDDGRAYFTIDTVGPFSEALTARTAWRQMGV